MEKELTVKFPEDYQKLSSLPPNGTVRKRKIRWHLPLLATAVLVLHSVVSIWYMKSEVQDLQKKVMLLQMKAEVATDLLKNLQQLIDFKLDGLSGRSTEPNMSLIDVEQNDNAPENEEPILSEEESRTEEENYDDGDNDANFGSKRKREIRDFNQNSAEQTENKSKAQKSSTETSSGEMSKEKLFPTSNMIFVSSTRKPHLHRKHRKSRIGSAERFFTETHSTTSIPIQVRQSRTKLTQMQGIDKTLWLQNQKFQQHTSPLKDTITKEEALKKGYGRHLEGVSHELDSSRERDPDALSYNMITIHFSADTSQYSRERDPHYFGNGRMQIKSEVYKDWKPAHWTQGVGMSKYFHLHQGRVTVSTTGIYLIYAQIQYSNVQEVNGFSVFRNKEVVVQCITTSTHPDKHEIKSNTCGISTTILLQSNDSVCIKDLHHGRYVVLTPEKSYFAPALAYCINWIHVVSYIGWLLCAAKSWNQDISKNLIPKMLDGHSQVLGTFPFHLHPEEFFLLINLYSSPCIS